MPRGAGGPPAPARPPPVPGPGAADCHDVGERAGDVYPGAAEVCNGDDDDCELLLDDADPGRAGSPATPPPDRRGSGGVSGAGASGAGERRRISPAQAPGTSPPFLPPAPGVAGAESPSLSRGSLPPPRMLPQPVEGFPRGGRSPRGRGGDFAGGRGLAFPLLPSGAFLRQGKVPAG